MVATSLISANAYAQVPQPATSRPADQQLEVVSPDLPEVQVRPQTQTGEAQSAGIPADPDEVVIPAEPDDAGIPPEPDDVGIPPEPDEMGIPPEPDDDGVIPPEPDPVEGPTADNYDPLLDSPEAIRAKHWRDAGIVLIVVGSVLTGGGIAMAASDPCNLMAGNGCQQSARNRAAATMAVPGAVMVVSGVASLAYGLVAQKRVRAQFQIDKRSVSLGFSWAF